MKIQNMLCNGTAMLVSSIAMTSCAVEVVDTGEVDFRRSSTVDRVWSEYPKIVDDSCGLDIKHGSQNQVSNQENADEGDSLVMADRKDGKCPAQVYPMKLVRKDAPGRALDTIVKGDVYSVRLKSAFISGDGLSEADIDFNPASASGRGELFAKANRRNDMNHQHKYDNYEIAVVANVSDADTPESKSHLGGIEFTSKELNDARVVYFSDDVAAGQFLNFSNMLIYGPKKFGGVGMRLTLGIIEVDAETKGQQELIKKLADFGAQMYPVIAPYVTILGQFGDTISDQNSGNDVVFRYDAILDAGPVGGLSNDTLFASNLEVGNYVLVRDGMRRRQTNWGQMILDENTSELYQCDRTLDENVVENDSDFSGCRKFTEATYMVVQIVKSSALSEVELGQGMTLSRLYDAFGKEQLVESDVTQALDRLGNVYQRNRKEAVSRDALQNIRSAVVQENKAMLRTALFDFSNTLIECEAEISSASKLAGNRVAKQNMPLDVCLTNEQFSAIVEDFRSLAFAVHQDNLVLLEKEISSSVDVEKKEGLQAHLRRQKELWTAEILAKFTVDYLKNLASKKTEFINEYESIFWLHGEQSQ